MLLPAALTVVLLGCARTSVPVSPSASGDPVISRDIAHRIDALMQAAITREHIAGLSLAIARDGIVIYSKGYGYRDLAARLPATPETIYNIASNSKQFTAACILLLQQDGKLNIGDTLSKYLPTFPSGDKITIRQILNHTSGLTDYLDMIDNATLTPAKVDAAVYKTKLKFKPGSKYDYSNTNFIIAGLIVDKVAGMPFDDFLKTHHHAARTSLHERRYRAHEPSGGRGWLYGYQGPHRSNRSADSLDTRLSRWGHQLDGARYREMG